MSTNLNQPLLLSLKAQTYPWGKIGKDSVVARLLGSYDVNKPYAELWIGAHPNGCSQVISSDGSESLALSTIISKYPKEILGERVFAKFGAELPFLAKILSVGKPLSIQAHPNKELAEKLHAADPKHYPDDNHKPEIGIAITPVKLLYGFRSISEIKATVEKTVEIAELIGQDLRDNILNNLSASNHYLLKSLYAALVKPSSQNSLIAQTAKLIDRLKNTDTRDENEELAIQLYGNFPNVEEASKDIGILSSLLLNIVTVNPGRAVFIAPNILHAYISGDLIECMANSDNVVRAGLTNKYQDVPTLVDMLDYQVGNLSLIDGVRSNGPVTRYITATEEFEIDIIETAFFEESLSDNKNVELIFCLEGNVSVNGSFADLEIKCGQAFVIPASLQKFSIKYLNGRFFRVRIP